MRSPSWSMLSLFALAVAACVEPPATVDLSAREQPLADEPGARPFLGWSSWSVQSSTRSGYGTQWLSEWHIRDASDAMRAKLGDAGYRYINIDSGWNADFAWSNFGYDDHGIPRPDPDRFPNGIDGIAAYVHANGQKLGLYFTVGIEARAYWGNYPIAGTSCRTGDVARQPLVAVPNGWSSEYEVDWSSPCAQAYYDSVAARFASWGVDLLKIDGTTPSSADDIVHWQQAIDHSGRPMWLTVSGWPVPISIAGAIRDAGQSVRVDTDIECYCNTVSSWDHSVRARWNDLPAWLAHLGPGHFPDLDAMPISNNRGNGIQDGLSDVERQSVMTFWSMASSPLYVGGDIYFLDDNAKAILSNPEVIAVDQAATLPTQLTGGNLQRWQKPLPDGRIAVAVFNLGSGAANIDVSWSALGLSGNARVRDLVTRTDLGTFTGSWTASGVPSHGSRLIAITPMRGPDGFAFCASEGQTCAPAGAVDVAYGADGQFVYRSSVTGSITCSNATFGDPAYGTTKSCYVRPAGGGTVYEAEAGARTGAASIASCAGCGGGTKVGYLGGGAGNTVTIAVSVGWTGNHVVTVHGLVDGTRTLLMQVDGGAPIAVPMTGSSWSTPITTAVTVPLAAGSHSLRFSNPSEWAPDLDRVVVW